MVLYRSLPSPGSHRGVVVATFLGFHLNVEERDVRVRDLEGGNQKVRNLRESGRS